MTQTQSEMLGAAYASGTKPTVFAAFKITPAIASGDQFTTRIRVMDKADKSIVAEGDATIVQGDVQVRGLTFSRAWPYQRTITYPEFDWQLDYGDGSWIPAGRSGGHKLYWLVDSPRDHPFRNFVGTSYDPIYDKVIEAALDQHATFPDLPSADDLPLRLTRLVKERHYSNPESLFGDKHPFELWERSNRSNSQSGFASDAFATLLTGMLRSVGVDAETVFMWSGTPGSSQRYTFDRLDKQFAVTFQANLAAIDNAPDKPHYDSHVLVRLVIGGLLYDPFYGLPMASSTTYGIDFLERYDPAYKILVPGNQTQQIDIHLPAPGEARNAADQIIVCPHHQ